MLPVNKKITPYQPLLYCYTTRLVDGAVGSLGLRSTRIRLKQQEAIINLSLSATSSPIGTYSHSALKKNTLGVL